MDKHCDYLLLLQLLGTKWGTPLLLELRFGKKTFNEILRNTKQEINKTLLSSTLQSFRNYGIISVSYHNEKKVYSLTDKGFELLEILNLLKNWSSRQNLCIGENCVHESCMKCGFFLKTREKSL